MKDNRDETIKRETEPEKGIERTRETRVYTPAVDIIDKKDAIVLLADMPGVDERSVEITLEKNRLTIHGRVEPQTPPKHKLVISEYGVGDYERTFTISNEIDRDQIRATVKDGVLRLTLHKAERARSRKIPVTGNA